MGLNEEIMLRVLSTRNRHATIKKSYVVRSPARHVAPVRYGHHINGTLLVQSLYSLCSSNIGFPL